MIVFKTDQPEQIEKFIAWQGERKAWSKAEHELAEEVTGQSSFMTVGTGRLSALPWPIDTELPIGWKRAKGQSYIVPDMRLKVGKDWSKRIAELPKVTERVHCDGQPGMVRHAGAPNGGAYMHEPTYHRFTDDGDLFMIWSCECKRDDDYYSIIKNVDAAIWEPVRLSEFYAEVEAEKDRAAAEAAL